MISKNIFEDILCKYPELIEPDLVLKNRHVSLHGQEVDLLFEDKFRKKLAVIVKTYPIEVEHVGEILSYENIILLDEDPSVSILVVSDKMPSHLQKTLDHNGIAWKEITTFQIKEHLTSRNDTKMLESLE